MKYMLTLQELELSLGESIKTLRLQKNLDRQTLCEMSGVSMNALRHLETGAGTTVKTLILVTRSLGCEDWITALAPQMSINPLHIVKMKKLRVRASRRVRKNDTEN